MHNAARTDHHSFIPQALTMHTSYGVYVLEIEQETKCMGDPSFMQRMFYLGRDW